MSTKTFASNISRFQRTYGLNNTDTAYVLGTSRRTLGRIKSARPGYNPLVETIETIADAFNVDTNEVTRRLPAAVIASVL